MDPSFIHPTASTPTAAQPQSVPFTMPSVPVTPAPISRPPVQSIGFRPVQDVQPASQPPAASIAPASLNPMPLPVVEPARSFVAQQFTPASEAQPASTPIKRAWSLGSGLRLVAICTALIVMTTGAALIFTKGQQPGSGDGGSARGVLVPEQDLGNEVELTELPGGLSESQTLIVNGDIRLQGALNFTNGEYAASVIQGNLTTDQAYTLPDASGEFCLSANNCAYVTAAQLTQVEVELEALQVLVADPQQLAAGSGIIITGDTIQNSGVLTLNGQNGAIVLTGGSGILVSGTTITNTGVTTLTGTANQVSVSGATGGITLSLPQSIAVTSSPTFAGLSVNGGGTFSGSITAGNLSGTNTGDITVSGQNYLSLSGQSITVGQVNLGGTHVTGTLPVTQGGTGLSTFNMHGVLYGNGTGALGVTVAGTNGQCLVGNTGAAPTWTSCTAASGGAAPGGAAGGDLGGTYPNPTIAKLQGTNLLINSPANGQILVYNTSNSRWDNVSSSLICPTGSGNLSGGGNSVDVGLGGTCDTLDTVASPQFSSLTLTAALPVTSGGTGMTGFTQYGLLFGNATGSLGVTVAGTTNECLTGNAGAAPSWIACNVISAGSEPGGSAGGDLGGTYPNPTIAKLQGSDILVNLPTAGHLLVYSTTNSRWDNVPLTGDITISQTGVTTIADLTTNGDLLYHNGTSVVRLARGADGQCLASNTTSILWSSCEGPNAILHNGNAMASSVTIGTNDNHGLNFEVNNTVVMSLSNTGDVLFKNTVNSTTAFQIQKADTTPLLTADTTNDVIKIATVGTPTLSGAALLVTAAEATTTLRVGDSTNGVEFSASGAPVYRGTARPTKRIALAPEFAGMVLSATGGSNTGTMTAGYDGTNNHNYYNWTTTQVTNQSYDLVVRIPVPNDYSALTASPQLCIFGYTTDVTNGTINVAMKDSANTGVTLSSASYTPGSTSAWTETCRNITGSPTITAGEWITLVITMQSPQSGNTRVGEVRLDYLGGF